MGIAGGAVRRRILVDLASQRLHLFEDDALLLEAAVSTGRNGPGEGCDSGCTPRVLHRVRIRIGAGCPTGTVFV
ncbi:MAG: L,D-transpeptidase, partial [Chromatiaceae bacterium]|nr:L,D-transpeptidase [Chromatiaceae bacterium]